MTQNEDQKLYIVPLPEIREKYEESIKHLQFNSWMESINIIQAVTVSYDYNDAIGGYEIILDAIDGGTYTLFVTLNWYWPMSELNTFPTPILASSHIRHEYSQPYPITTIKSNITLNDILRYYSIQ